MSPFSVPLSLSSRPSQDVLQDRLGVRSDSSSRSSTKVSRSHLSAVFAGLTNRQSASPHVLSTNLNSSAPSLSSSPSSTQAPSSPNGYSWSKPDSLSPNLTWDLDDSFTPSSPVSVYSSSPIDDLLAPGDVVCHGGFLQSEPIHIVPIAHQAEHAHHKLGEEFEVVRRLGAGSYAVVYLVREVLARPSSDDDHSFLGHMDLDDINSDDDHSTTVYGREYAIKCLSKANLEEGALASQLTEAMIHQSLRPHPNIVTLHRTFETSSFLLLLLEYVPGEDLYYFLSRARDRYEMDPVESFAVFTSCTPPTPGLLSASNPSQILSPSRLRLISSMFSQICDAVDVCHSNNVFHRDIKPENLIVTDTWATSPNGTSERKVAVKLSDFGLATTDVESADMDCGSAPYMSYECRNNVSPYYRPRGADIWSLGIVLLNMLYHRNPWTDTAQGACISFEHFRRRPVAFLMKRFSGMKRPVAEFLAKRVFCILENPMDDSPRVTAKEFGQWAKDLPRLLLDRKDFARAPRPVAVNEEHPLSAFAPPSHRPSSRNTSISSTYRTPLTRGPSQSVMPTLEPPSEQIADDEQYSFYDPDLDDPENDLDYTNPAVNPVFASKTTMRPFALTTSFRSEKSTIPPSPTSATTPTVTKKNSIWKLSFGKNSGGSDRTPPASAVSPPAKEVAAGQVPMSATASNVTNLIMGLTAPSNTADLHQSTWTKGRQPKSDFAANRSKKGPTHDSIKSSQFWSGGGNQSIGVSSLNSMRSDPALVSSASSVSSGNWRSSMSSTSSLATSNSAFTRYSNNSTRSISTAATSVSSSSWRSGNGNSLSPFQKKTSPLQTMPRNIKPLSAMPWELGQAPSSIHSKTSDNLFGSPPLKQRTVLSTDIFGSPPIIVQSPRRNPKDFKLGTIAECPRTSSISSTSDTAQKQQDAATSTSEDIDEDSQEDSNGRKKVQKGQINALAKMLSALRR